MVAVQVHYSLQLVTHFRVLLMSIELQGNSRAITLSSLSCLVVVSICEGALLLRSQQQQQQQQ